MSEEESLLNAAAEPTTEEATGSTETTTEGWFLNEEVKGEGEVPEWFKSDKYKSVAEQAKAYAGLESKLGAFTGAPKDGYSVELPEGINFELDNEDPMLVNFNEWATEAGLSQDAHTKLMEIYANGLLEAQPSIAEEKKRMGKDADQRITDFTLWAKDNFDDGEFETMLGLTTTAESFGVLEKMRMMMRETQVSAPDNVKPISSMTREKLYEMQGDERYTSSPSFRKEVDNKFKEFFGTQPASEVRN